QKYTNGGVPFKTLRTWYNPGDVDVYVSNYNDNTDQYVATTTMTVENSLVDFFTPYQQFTGVLKITFITEIDFGEGFTFKSKSEQFYVKDLGLVGYYSYSPINQTEFESYPDYMELLLSARVRGMVYENPPKINSAPVLSDAIIGSLYPVTLNSTGGAFPHRFTLISGAPPLGLALTENGQFSGTVQDQPLGVKTFTVKLTDAYHQFYIQEFSITVR
ncbi:MAG TPA: putative Ig domain-containing protein, partial [Candidatus Rifleibacterium sp.]|nr:putative Ig domain-containing protein [Candidatus Rifleibacterium sp.]